MEGPGQTESETRSIVQLVVDSGGFIHNVSLKDLATEVYTVRDVVFEIKDQATRERLQVLPYVLHFKTPSPESYKAVADFAKQTGDYRVLSRTDLNVLALTYELHKQSVGLEGLKKAPARPVQSYGGGVGDRKNIPGFVMLKDKQDSKAGGDSQLTQEGQEGEGTEEESQADSGTAVSESVTLKELIDLGKETEHLTVEEGSENKEVVDQSGEGQEEDDDEKDDEGVDETEEGKYEDEEEDDEDWSEDDDDDEGWITSENLAAVRKELGAEDEGEELANCPVACLTTDYAMQNVLIQMGLRAVSTQGYLIKNARCYVLRCRACNQTTSQMEKKFCPHCGNNTLHRMAVRVNADGSVTHFLKRNYRPNTRGTRFSLPMPKGGKHAQNPVLCEDQPIPQQRVPRAAREKTDVWNADYVYQSRNSPFALKDVTSRSAQLGIRSGGENTGRWTKRNPNASSGGTGNRRKGKRK